MNNKLVNGHKRGKYNNNKYSLYENSSGIVISETKYL